ncbi:MAG: hypothetical protein QOI94_3113 [Acidobacteriaceae bacterium]|nr:hypothetical protein [Acidobacteriaceae bacterium]
MKRLIRSRLLFALWFAVLPAALRPLYGQAVTFLGNPVDFGDVDVCAAGQTTPGPCSKTMTFFYKVTAGGTLQKPKVLTMGVPYLDFAFARSSCMGTVTTGSRCSVAVTLTPKVAGLRSGSVEIVNGSGKILATTLIHGIGQADPADFKITLSPPSLAVSPGSGQPVQVTATALNGFTGTTTVALSGLPPGVESNPNSLTLPPGATRAITLTAGNTTAAEIGNVVFTGNSGSLTHTATLALTVTAAGTSVTTYHNDNARDGWNSLETVLTPQTVIATAFGKLRQMSVDGKVAAQPLYVSSLSIAGQTRNVLITVTEHGTAYAFDADEGFELWHVSTLASNETTSDDHSCAQISPEIGITDTPVIDRGYGTNGAVFLVAMSKDAQGAYHQRLHALDLTTGAELGGSPSEIEATYPGNGYGSSDGMQVFAPGQYAERVGLLLMNGQIYVAWTSHCDQDPYTGWLMAYSESTLQQTGVFNLTPNGPSSPRYANGEGSIWMSGAGLGADAQGNIFFLDGNGTFDATLDGNHFPAKGDFGNAFLKISTNGNKLAVADYFATHNTLLQSAADQDLGSGGVVLLPDLVDAGGVTRRLAVGAGKDRNIYVVDRTNMGKFNGRSNTMYQEVSNALSGGVFSAPAFFNNTVYYAALGDHLKAFPVTQALLATTPAAQSANTFSFPGATPSISSNGTQNGIVWAIENQNGAGILHAYDATNLASELYNSNQASGIRDHFPYNRFVAPTIANGKVFVGTTNSVAVFGLFP